MVNKVVGKIKIIRRLKARFFLILALVLTILTVFALRANNEEMVRLRNAVYQADKSGQNVQGALNNLQSYVTSHMNTSLTSGNTSVYPPIQLKYTYQRLVQAQNNSSANSNSKIYSDAEYYCQSKIPVGFSGRYRVPCIEQYISTHGLNNGAIPTSLYEFDFISPSWSPDLAGWLVIAAIIAWICFVLKLVFMGWNKFFN